MSVLAFQDGEAAVASASIHLGSNPASSNGVGTVRLDDEAISSKSWKAGSKWSIILLIVPGLLVLVGLSIMAAFAVKRDSNSSQAYIGPASSKDDVNFRERFISIRAILSSSGDPTDFSTADTPQSKALNWLVYKDESLGDNDVHRLLQRYAVMVLYYACGGQDWLSLVTPYDELYKVNECRFPGIRCDDSGAIVEVRLSDERLTGQLPKEVGLLTNLVGLDLTNNFLEGSLPKTVFMKLTNLGKAMTFGSLCQPFVSIGTHTTKSPCC